MKARDFLIELNEVNKDSKIKISPVGEKVVGRDGRVFNFNGEEVIKATKKRSGFDVRCKSLWRRSCRVVCSK